MTLDTFDDKPCPQYSCSIKNQRNFPTSVNEHRQKRVSSARLLKPLTLIQKHFTFEKHPKRVYTIIHTVKKNLPLTWVIFTQ